MNGTLLACRLFGTITTTVQPLESIVQQLLTVRTKLLISLVFPAIQTYHLFNDCLLFCYSLVHTSANNILADHRNALYNDCQKSYSDE